MEEKSVISKTKQKKNSKIDKFSKKKMSQSVEIEKKAKIEEKIRDRVSMEARAFDVVNRLIESPVSANYLTEAVSQKVSNLYTTLIPTVPILRYWQ